MTGSTTAAPASPGGLTTVRLLLTLGLVAIVTIFFRGSVGVIAPDLARELGLTAEDLGLLTGAFFLTFALTQIPIGLMLDRFGPRRTISGMMIIAVAGSLLFAVSDGLTGLVVARVMMSIGCGAIMVGCFIICSRWFPPARFAAMVGLVSSMSNGGNLLATTPLAAAVETWGWRPSFVGMAVIAAAIAALLFFTVRDAPPGHPFLERRAESLRDVLRGVRDVFREPQLRYLLAVTVVAYPAFVSIMALWAGPYLFDVHGLDPVQRGNVMLAMAVANIIGPLCFGEFIRRIDSYRRAGLIGGAATVLVMVLLAVLPHPPVWLIVVLFAGLGFFSTFGIVVMTYTRGLYPDRMAGRAMTMVNLFTQTSAGLMQVVTGLIVGVFSVGVASAPPVAYRTVFGFLALVLLIAVVVFSRIRELRPSGGWAEDAKPD